MQHSQLRHRRENSDYYKKYLLPAYGKETADRIFRQRYYRGLPKFTSKERKNLDSYRLEGRNPFDV